jgi:hypothetical protein
VRAPRIGDTGAELLDGEIGVLLHQLADQGIGGVQRGSPATSMRFGRDVASRAVTA